MDTKHQEVQQYYGIEVTSTDDLKTNACCTSVSMPPHIKNAMSVIHNEVMAKYYGCGLTIPSALEGAHILDLGSGSGRDCYIAAQLVGEQGSVIGVDMTDEQLDVANRYVDYHREQFGYKNSNTKFLKGNLEDLDKLNIAKESIDIIISNCVINLCVDKYKVLSDAYRMLKPGGEMYFSDVYCDRRIPENLKKDKILWGECLSGALYWNDFLHFSKKAGFIDPRVVESSIITIENEKLSKQLEGYSFYSVTYRMFKIDGLEPDCEDYGQAVSYKGTILHQPNTFDLDNHHHFPKGKVVPVCGNTYDMLFKTRFKEHFDYYGYKATHYGIFEGCGVNSPFNEDDKDEPGSCC